METNNEMSEREKAMEGYRRVQPADRPLINELLVKAKGPKRSMRQFAIDCGVSPSTFTRMAQAESGSVSNDMLYKIASNADPDSGIDFEKLMRANGMIKITEGSANLSFTDYKVLVRNILLNEILKYGYTVRYSNVTETDNRKRIFEYIPDVQIFTDAIPASLHYAKEDGYSKGEGRDANWIFEICRKSQIMPYQRTALRIYQQILMVWGYYYSRQFYADKISFVVDDSKVFEKLKEILDGIELSDWTSVILVNTESGQVENEYNIAIEGVDVIPEVFKRNDITEQPVQNNSADLFSEDVADELFDKGSGGD